MQYGDQFETVEVAREAIKRYVLDNGESFKVRKSDKKRFYIVCKERGCGFSIRASKSSKEVVSITTFKPHTCSPAVHYNNQRAHLVSYLIEHHRASIIDNCKITVAQIRSNERLQFNNEIGYMLAYRTIQAVLTEMYGDEAESFAKFPALAERFQAADEDNFCKIAYHDETSHFQAAFFAPRACRRAGKWLRPLLGINGTYTSSKFQMTLLVAVCIDANDKTLPMAWALVPIELEAQQAWFLKQFQRAFHLDGDRRVVISNREKGLPPTLEKTILNVTQAYYCQHIADNVQQRFGMKCRPLFQACARAKYKGDFKDALKALMDKDVNARNYVNAIDYKLQAFYAFEYPRYGHDTNNNTESVNFIWANIQKLLPLQMMDAIYTQLMKTVYERHHRNQRSTEIADVPLLKFNNRLANSRRY